MALIRILLAIFFFILECHLILAQDKPCAGHDVKISKFRNCPEPKSQHIKIQNISFALTDDCRLVPRGCVKVTKPISKAKVEYYINKPPFKKKGTEDFCKVLESPDTQKFIENYKTLPHKCTISPGDYCLNKGNTKIEQLSPRTLNLISGTTNGYFSIENEDSGDKGCVEFTLTVSKKG